MKRRIAARIPPPGHGQTLLDYLSGRFSYHSVNEWQNRIRSGELILSGSVCTNPQQILAAGELLEYCPTEIIEPEVCCDYRIVYEDDHLLVIDKPGNLPVHPSGPYFAHTLWAMLYEQKSLKLHFINRLDRETSGLLIAAKDSDSAGKLSAILPEMRKHYQVIIHGHFPQEMLCRGWICKDTGSSIRKKQLFIPSDAAELPPDGGVLAETFFSAAQYCGNLTLLNAYLTTGRMHQIRATLRSLNFPVVGDKLYGLDEQFYRRFALGSLSEDDREKLRISRQALHCCSLSFTHPHSGECMSFHAPLPAELAELLA